MKICIVGNGAGVLKKQNGVFIDSCDVVVRIKDFRIAGYEAHVGTKTDWYASKCFNWLKKDMSFLQNVSHLFFMFPDPSIESKTIQHDYVQQYITNQLKWEFPDRQGNKTTFHHVILGALGGDKKITFFDEKDVTELCIHYLRMHMLNYKLPSGYIIEPTCGIRTLFKIVQLYPLDEIYITGFDGFKTGWYWDITHAPNNAHCYLRERILLAKLVNRGSIIDLDENYNRCQRCISR